MRGELDPDEIMEDSLEAYFARMPAGGGGVYASLLAALALAAMLLPFIRVDVTVRAPGMLRPAIERHRLAAAASGVVERVAARMGDTVRAGQLLVALRQDELTTRLTAAESTAAQLRARAADLTALLRFADRLERSRVSGHVQLDDEARAAGHVPAAGSGENAGSDFPHLPRYRDERARGWREWEGAAREVAPARAAAARAGDLASRGLLPPAELEEAVLRRARAVAEPPLVVARLRASWGAELAQVEASLRTAGAERARLGAEARLGEVRAPVAGTLEALSALSPGSWVGAGEEVGVISPAAPLVAELYVESREIGRVRPGLPVRLVVDAFDQHEWGTLPAVVHDVSGDFVIVEGHPAFRVRCTLRATTLRRPDGRRALARKGMTVTAAFVLGRVRLLHLLWDRAAARLGPPPVSAGSPAAGG